MGASFLDQSSKEQEHLIGDVCKRATMTKLLLPNDETWGGGGGGNLRELPRCFQSGCARHSEDLILAANCFYN